MGHKRIDFKFTPAIVFQMYDWYANGENDEYVAKQLGLKIKTYHYRKDHHPGAKAAIKYGRIKYRESKANRSEFDDIVFGRLPQELKATWMMMKREAKEPTGFQPVQKMEQRQKQILWVHAWVKSNFSVQKACTFLQIPQRVVTLWREQPSFKKLMEGMVEIKKDFIEDSLLGLIRRQNPLATVFAAKTQLRDRGYGEKTEVVGRIEHRHEVQQFIDLTDLDLPVDVQMVIMDAIERKKKRDDAPKTLLLEFPNAQH